MGIPAGIGVGASGIPPAGDIAHAVLTGTFTAIGPSQPFGFQGFANFAVWASINTALTTTAGSLSASVSSGTGLAAGVAVNSVNVPAGTTWATFSGTTGTLALPTQSYYGLIDEAGTITGMPSTTGLLGAAVTGPGIPGGTTVASVLSSSSVALSAAPTSIPALAIPQSFTFAPTGAAIRVSGADSKATFTGAGIGWTGLVNIERSFDGGSTWIVCNAGPSLAQYPSGPVNTSWNEPERGVLYRLNCVAYSSGTINYRISQTAAAAMALTTGGVAG